ncbi:MAG: IS3 family transposase [Candidatus Competibacteraceae bacterium]|nr:IS3 family transposase [Candidatus Competibacteraceae bacterium]
MKFSWIHQHRHGFEVAAMCRVLRVSRAGYYAWRGRPPAAQTARQERLIATIREVHAESRGSYGSPRIHAELIERQISGCVNTVAKLMRQHGIRSKRRRRYRVCTTDSRHDRPVFENKLDREFQADRPNRKWVCDITYVPTEEGFLYLAIVMDLFSRKIVGWAMADHLRAELCLDALRMAIGRRRLAPGSGLLHHSDRGVQYASGDYQHELDAWGINCSMSRRGNCYDNAAMESFFSSLKTELVHHKTYVTRRAASGSIFEWIEGWYNRRRRHSTLDYLSPEAYETSMN